MNNLAVCLTLVLAFTWMCSAQPAPAKPIPPTTFYSEGIFMTPVVGYNMGRTWYDEDNFRIRNDILDPSGNNLLATTLTTFQQGREYTINVTTQTCITTPTVATWNNFWSFLDDAQYYGSSSEYNCQLWGKMLSADAVLSSCWQDNSPVVVGVFFKDQKGWPIGTTYSNFKLGVDPSVFNPPKYCPVLNNIPTPPPTLARNTFNDHIRALNLNFLFNN